MAMIQNFPLGQLTTTFGQLSEKVLLSALALGIRFKASRIDNVGDRCDTVSIENKERGRRANGAAENFTIFGSDQTLPKQWSKFLASSTNLQSVLGQQ